VSFPHETPTSGTSPSRTVIRLKRTAIGWSAISAGGNGLRADIPAAHFKSLTLPPTPHQAAVHVKAGERLRGVGWPRGRSRRSRRDSGKLRR
jgi:hypothetical protein